jgi:acetolactate synthase I/III small subunit
LKGISKFTIVVISTEEQVQKIVQQIEKQVEVLKAFYHTNDEMIYQEIALYKVSTDSLLESNKIETLVRKHNARILEITKDYTVIEKTGHKDETQAFFHELNEFRVLQFIRSGRIAITRSPIERLSEFLKERDEMLSNVE